MTAYKGLSLFLATFWVMLVYACGGSDSERPVADGGDSFAIDGGDSPDLDAAPLPAELDCALISDYPAGTNLLQVGPGKTYATPSAANEAAVDGDTIEIAAGEYENDFTTWRQSNLTLRGVGGLAHMKATRNVPDSGNGKGIWVIKGNQVRVENIEFSGARVTDENGAGIRAEGDGLSICNASFHENQNGILGGAGEVVVEFSEFNHNGKGGVGLTHNMYISGNVTKFTLRHSYSHHAEIGHNLKSRAQENYILYNRIMDEIDGNSSYTIDLPNGGLSFVIGNLLQQSPQTDNSAMLRYGAEGLDAARTNELYVVNNTFVNDRGSGIFVSTEAPASLINNLFIGGGTMLSGQGTSTTNLEAVDGIVDRAGFEFRLSPDSAAINAGSDPGSAQGFNMAPTHQYLHPLWMALRPQSGAIDIGAYEVE